MAGFRAPPAGVRIRRGESPRPGPAPRDRPPGDAWRFRARPGRGNRDVRRQSRGERVDDHDPDVRWLRGHAAASRLVPGRPGRGRGRGTACGDRRHERRASASGALRAARHPPAHRRAGVSRSAALPAAAPGPAARAERTAGGRATPGAASGDRAARVARAGAAPGATGRLPDCSDRAAPGPRAPELGDERGSAGQRAGRRAPPGRAASRRRPARPGGVRTDPTWRARPCAAGNGLFEGAPACARAAGCALAPCARPRAGRAMGRAARATVPLEAACRSGVAPGRGCCRRPRPAQGRSYH